jgi:hypothetical protein
VKAVEGIIKQRRATAPAPPSDDRAVREQAPSVEPARPSVKGEDIKTSPSVKTPVPGPPVLKAEPSSLPPGLAATGSVIERWLWRPCWVELAEARRVA